MHAGQQGAAGEGVQIPLAVTPELMFGLRLLLQIEGVSQRQMTQALVPAGHVGQVHQLVDRAIIVLGDLKRLLLLRRRQRLIISFGIVLVSGDGCERLGVVGVGRKMRLVDGE